ncbi:MAG: hypothetical protein Q7J16_12080 [Candidatus Cloacimonadales bacterium]|nr:hypothetical protein [Candidatus Cloacimonadales bacterium]
MDIILTGVYTEGDIEDWKFATIIMNGATEESHQQYKVQIRRTNELLESLLGH